MLRFNVALAYLVRPFNLRTAVGLRRLSATRQRRVEVADGDLGEARLFDLADLDAVAENPWCVLTCHVIAPMEALGFTVCFLRLLEDAEDDELGRRD